MSKEEMGNNECNVEDTLKQRGSIYGSYKDVCETRDKILSILFEHSRKVSGGKGLSNIQAIGFGDLVLKLVRGAGAPDYADSFHDLGGYAKLMEDLANEAHSKKA